MTHYQTFAAGNCASLAGCLLIALAFWGRAEGALSRAEAGAMVSEWVAYEDLSAADFDPQMNAAGRVSLGRENARVAFTYDESGKALQLHRVAMMSDNGRVEPAFLRECQAIAGQRYAGKAITLDYLAAGTENNAFILLSTPVTRRISARQISQILKGALADEADWWLNKGFLQAAHRLHGTTP